jgi:hypothetical protein
MFDRYKIAVRADQASMNCEVEYTDEFGDWWNDISEDEQDSVAAKVQLLEQLGPQLPHPHSSGTNGSRHSHMRELRIQHQGDPYLSCMHSTRGE